MPRIAVLAALATIALGAGATAAEAAPCPGATNCPWVATQTLGNHGGGTLRFPQAVAIGFDGRFYVGDVFSHEVQVFNPDGSFQEEWGSAGTGAGQFGAIGGIAVGRNGSVYVVDTQNRVERFTLDGQYLGSFGSPGTGLGQFAFGSGPTNASPGGGGITVSGQYVFVADTRNNRIERFDLDGRNPYIIGAGQVKYPQGLWASPTKLVVADDDDHRLVIFDFNGKALQTIGTGPGNRPGQLNSPYDVTGDAHGNLYVADDLNHRVVRFGPQPKHAYLAFWGGYGQALGQLQYPRALTADLAGNTYVTDTGGNRIQEFSPTGQSIRAFGSNGRAAGQFTDPEGVAFDPQGFRAVADTVDGRIEILDGGGNVVAQWGAPAPGPTLLAAPVALAFDTAGNGYVVNRSRSQIIVFNRAGQIIKKLGGPGNGPGQMEDPSAIAITPAGDIYVADTGNGRIAHFGPGGVPEPSFGSFTQIDGIAVTPDGSHIYATDASTNRITVMDPAGEQLDQLGGTGKKPGHFMTIGGIAIDPAGHLWVTERGGNRIQELDPITGKGLLVFGSRGLAPGQFVHPTGIAVGCDGFVSVADSDANRVQVFQLAQPSAGACSVLSPLASTPNIKLPTAPPAPQPDLLMTLVHRLGIVHAHGIEFVARCDQTCALNVTATLTPITQTTKGQKPTIVKFAPLETTLQPGVKRTIRVPLSSFAIAQVTKAFGKKKSGKLTLTYQATAAASASAGTPVPPTAITQTVTVTR